MKNVKMVFAVVLGWVTAASTAFAAVPTEVTTAISTSGTDAATVASAVFVVLVGIYAIKLMRKGL
ncbi:hypothetical protein SKTS_21770 [Sulfurimicrobium lacus]|uniref:Uncharacterized protein n=1 Tax=Sulfurimicrobium lacus TaxID=2715678 RepID=A0A6F8VDQ6_9PROT|nr:major capsid protein [Sulfurimicrobium lacus]BCB27291.1 hypothetical protein SKTS_21770 [Sulfurimicrobium lacus]